MVDQRLLPIPRHNDVSAYNASLMEMNASQRGEANALLWLFSACHAAWKKVLRQNARKALLHVYVSMAVAVERCALAKRLVS
jgi:hypothetical protein